MEKRIEQRLTALRRELELGQRQLQGLEARAQELRHTLLRISGAIQVLEEIQREGTAEAPANTETAASEM